MKKNLIKIRILSTNEIFSVDDKDLTTGQEIIVQANNIIEPAIVLCDKECPKNIEIDQEKDIKVIRSFSDEDKIKKETLKKEVYPYLVEAQKKVFRHGLAMKILDADFSFDKKKLTFYFTAEGRVDFRALVSDMAGDFGKLIRLQQIGPREQATILSGLGRCGRVLCCKEFLHDFDNINLKVNELNEAGFKPTKNIGCCGRPMCCLAFEAENKDEKTKKEKKEDK